MWWSDTPSTNGRDVIIISCIGSRKDSITYCFDDDILWCGCFKGILLKFAEQVKKYHAENPQFLKEYLGAIEYIKSLMKEDTKWGY